MNVLIVEPDRDLSTLLAFLARRSGHRVTSVTNATDALSSLLMAYPDMVVAESVLPDGSGLALCQAVRRIGEAGVILVGDAADVATGAQARAFGALAYLEKPVSPNLLRAWLAPREAIQPVKSVAASAPPVHQRSGWRRQVVPA